MTLGSSPQPLTRRQARELAQGLDSSENGGDTAEATPPPEPDSRPESFTELIQKAEAAAKASALPLPGQRQIALPAHDSDDEYFASLERTMTRRELRALQVAHAAEAPDAAKDSAVSAEAEFVDQIDEPVAIVAVESVPAEAVPAEAVPPIAEIALPPIPAFPVVDDAPDAPRELNPPIGHWSIDPEIDGVDDHTLTVSSAAPFDSLISRGVSAGGVPTTTNTLILSAAALQDRTSGPLDSTGEILITGSIDLPRSLGSTGAHPDRFDSADVDHMLDNIDESGASADVAPVSASRAVSSHASTRGVMTPPKKEVAWLPTVLTITAAALALGVVALFVGAFIFNIF